MIPTAILTAVPCSDCGCSPVQDVAVFLERPAKEVERGS
jgi:hypothetical protein